MTTSGRASPNARRSADEVAHVDRVELHAALERLADPGARAAVQVVGDRDLVAAIEERVDEMGADEAGTAGDDDPHGEQS